MGEKPEYSLGMTPEEQKWLHDGDQFWHSRGKSASERRDVLWFFAAILVFFFGNLFACPIRST